MDVQHHQADRFGLRKTVSPRCRQEGLPYAGRESGLVLHDRSASGLLDAVRHQFIASFAEFTEMSIENSGQRLTGQDWFWIVFIAIVGTVATFGGFVLFLPAYVLALLVGYIATKRFPKYFNRRKRAIFVLKVLGVVVPVFALLLFMELALMD